MPFSSTDNFYIKKAIHLLNINTLHILYLIGRMALISVVPPIFINNLVEFIDIYYFINTSRKAFISNSSNKINLIIAITFATVLPYTRLFSSKRNLQSEISVIYICTASSYSLALWNIFANYILCFFIGFNINNNIIFLWKCKGNLNEYLLSL